MHSVGAIVLAGGSSRRMGRCKAWLETGGGEPLLCHVAAVLKASCAPVVVVGMAGQSLPRCPGTIRVDDLPKAGWAGPLVGIATGLASLQQMQVAFAYIGCCDAPLLSSRHVHQVVQLLLHTPAVEMVVPAGPDGRQHPLAAAVRVKPTAAMASRLLERGERRAMALLDTLAHLSLGADELEDPSAIAPCNTPAQWTDLRERLRARGAS